MDVAVTRRWHPAGGSDSPAHIDAGFTLVELLAVMALLVVLTTIAVPRMRNLITDTRITTGANQFLSALNLARQVAVTRDQRAVLCPSADGRSCLNVPHWHRGWIVFVDRNVNHRLDADESIVRRHAPLPGVVLVSSRGRKKITFRYDGATYGSNATFRLCARGQPDSALTIVLSNPGRARVARPGGRDGPIRCPQL